MEGKKLMYDALIAQCEAERTEALFTLNNYIENIKFLTKQNLFWLNWETYKISKKKLIFNKNNS